MKWIDISPLLVAALAPLAFSNGLGFSKIGSVGQSTERASVGCGAGERIERVTPDVAKSILRKAEVDPSFEMSTPDCPTNCTVQDWIWSVCLKVGPEPTCQLWRHDFKVYFCSGATYYNCDGAVWENSGGPCPMQPINLRCTLSNPENLPAGCVPPVNASWIYCD
jgi:hypothetical protein